jgi:diaminopimelate epimerase
MMIETDEGVVRSRVVHGRPEIELQPVFGIRESVGPLLGPGERRMGFAVAGVPHVIVLCGDVKVVDVPERGAALRRADWTGPEGANVNFVSGDGASWAIRTFERGVEAETLACGTGAVATATLLRRWGLSAQDTALRTRSGCVLEVALRDVEGEVIPRLGGEGRLVFEGLLDGG